MGFFTEFKDAARRAFGRNPSDSNQSTRSTKRRWGRHRSHAPNQGASEPSDHPEQPSDASGRPTTGSAHRPQSQVIESQSAQDVHNTALQRAESGPRQSRTVTKRQFQMSIRTISVPRSEASDETIQRQVVDNSQYSQADSMRGRAVEIPPQSQAPTLSGYIESIAPQSQAATVAGKSERSALGSQAATVPGREITFSPELMAATVPGRRGSL